MGNITLEHAIKVVYIPNETLLIYCIEAVRF